MNSKEAWASVRAVSLMHLIRNYQAPLATTLFFFIVYLACFARIDLSFLDVFSCFFGLYHNHPVVSMYKLHAFSDETEITKPKFHLVLTAQCMFFALIPIYANMLFALVQFKDRGSSGQSAESSCACSLKCSLSSYSKETISKELYQSRAINYEHKKLKNEGYVSKSKRDKAEITRDESLESLSTYCGTPLIDPRGIASFRKVALPSPITPFLADSNTKLVFSCLSYLCWTVN